jgi:hypothetical protein
MKTMIAICILAAGLSVAGVTVSTRGHSAPGGSSAPSIPALAEDGGHGCLIDYDEPCSDLR